MWTNYYHIGTWFLVPINEVGTWPTSSLFSTYVLAASVVNCRAPHHLPLIWMKRIRDEVDKDPLGLPYSPDSKVRNTRRESAARNVPFYLGLLLKERVNVTQNRSLLLQALENYVENIGDLSLHGERDGAHFRDGGMAPYYFYSTVTYATSATKLLLQTSQSKEERQTLRQINEKLARAILGKRQPSGLFRREGARQDWKSSIAYTNPFAGLALLPLLTTSSATENEFHSWGIIDPIEADAFIAISSAF